MTAEVKMLAPTIPLDEADALLLRAMASDIIELQAALGTEYERHLDTIAKIKPALEKARADYQSLVDMFAKKYIKQPGRIDFRPELGAFVTRGPSEE